MPLYSLLKWLLIYKFSRWKHKKKVYFHFLLSQNLKKQGSRRFYHGYSHENYHCHNRPITTSHRQQRSCHSNVYPYFHPWVCWECLHLLWILSFSSAALPYQLFRAEPLHCRSSVSDGSRRMDYTRSPWESTRWKDSDRTSHQYRRVVFLDIDAQHDDNQLGQVLRRCLSSPIPTYYYKVTCLRRYFPYLGVLFSHGGYWCESIFHGRNGKFRQDILVCVKYRQFCDPGCGDGSHAFKHL